MPKHNSHQDANSGQSGRQAGSGKILHSSVWGLSNIIRVKHRNKYLFKKWFGAQHENKNSLWIKKHNITQKHLNNLKIIYKMSDCKNTFGFAQELVSVSNSWKHPLNISLECIYANMWLGYSLSTSLGEAIIACLCQWLIPTTPYYHIVSKEKSVKVCRKS